MITGLALHERAALVGLTSREYIALHAVDPRVLTEPALATDGAVARLRRWLDAGRPDADPTSLVFRGSDAVRAIVRNVVAAIPAPVRWHAVSAVVWLEVGRGTGGWFSVMPEIPRVTGDQPHLIALAGDRDDERLPGYVAHELAHSWQWGIASNPIPRARTAMTDAEEDRVLLSVVSSEILVERRYRFEVIADNLAATWGFPVHGNTHDPGLRGRMAAALASKGEIQ